MRRTIATAVAVLLSLRIPLVEAVKERKLRGHQSNQERSVQANRQRKAASTRIIGGRDAPAGSYPFVAEFDLGCGASLIAPDMLLTVAHCYEVIRDSDFAYVGSNRLREGAKRRISKTIVHPQYNVGTSAYDFMLVKLAYPVSNVEPVQLNDDPGSPRVITVSKDNGNDHENELGEMLTIVGFGVTKEGDILLSSKLQEARVPFVDQETCAKWYKDYWVDKSTMFCAGYEKGGVDSCQGDSGGPILNEDGVQVGVTSWGQGCAQKKSPGVYGRVSVAFNWIQQNVCEFASIKPSYCFPDTTTATTTNTNTITNTTATFNQANALETGHVLELSIKYDANPNEVAWILVQTDTNKIIDYVSYGRATVPYDHVTLRYENLESGHYRFLITDSQKNGICCASGSGSIVISETFADGSATVLWADNGTFGAGVFSMFELKPPQPSRSPSQAPYSEPISVTRKQHHGGV